LKKGYKLEDKVFATARYRLSALLTKLFKFFLNYIVINKIRGGLKNSTVIGSDLERQTLVVAVMKGGEPTVILHRKAAA
jgi:hypothetical protein